MKTLAIGGLPSVIAKQRSRRRRLPPAKPTLLLRWLVRVVAPPAAFICDPSPSVSTPPLPPEGAATPSATRLTPASQLAGARLRNQLKPSAGNLAQRKTYPRAPAPAPICGEPQGRLIARFNAPRRHNANPPTDDAFIDIPDETPGGLTRPSPFNDISNSEMQQVVHWVQNVTTPSLPSIPPAG